MNAYTGYAASGNPSAPVISPTPSPPPTPPTPPNNPVIKKLTSPSSSDYKKIAIYGGIGIVIFVILFILIIREKKKY
jgi:hypothetical protein